jgi:hypothetical protein
LKSKGNPFGAKIKIKKHKREQNRHTKVSRRPQGAKGYVYGVSASKIFVKIRTFVTPVCLKTFMPYF